MTNEKYVDLTKYVHNPPTIEEIKGETLNLRKNNNHNLAVIVGSYNDNKRLRQYLNWLKKQTYNNFDVIIIYGENDKFLRNFDNELSILHVKRKFDIGFAGAIYLGQKIAVNEGYKYISQSDADRFIINKKAYEIMIKKIEKDKNILVVGGDVRAKEDKKLVAPGLWGLVFNSIIKREFFEKYGYYFLPFYAGGDDTDFSNRIWQSNKFVKLKKIISEHLYPYPQDMIILSTYKLHKHRYYFPATLGLAIYFHTLERYIEFDGKIIIKNAKFYFLKSILLRFIRLNLDNLFLIEGINKMINYTIKGKFKFSSKPKNIKFKITKIDNRKVFDQFIYANADKDKYKIIKRKKDIQMSTNSRLRYILSLLRINNKGETIITKKLFTKPGMRLLNFCLIFLRFKQIYVLLENNQIVQIRLNRNPSLFDIVFIPIKSLFQTIKLIYNTRGMTTEKYGIKP